MLFHRAVLSGTDSRDLECGDEATGSSMLFVDRVWFLIATPEPGRQRFEEGGDRAMCSYQIRARNEAQEPLRGMLPEREGGQVIWYFDVTQEGRDVIISRL